MQGASPKKPHVIVIGGGAIGCCITYYLTQKQAQVTLVEKCSIACGASGKSGGFLAADWNDSSPLGTITRKSFDLHVQLSQTLGVEYNFRKVNTLSVAAREKDIIANTANNNSSSSSNNNNNNNNAQQQQAKKPQTNNAEASMNWLDAPLLGVNVIGTTQSTAQLNPEKFVNALADVSSKRGAVLQLGSAVVGLVIEKDANNPQGYVTRGVKLADNSVLYGDSVVIAMGPWSNNAANWLPEDIRKLVPVRSFNTHDNIYILILLFFMYTNSLIF